MKRSREERPYGDGSEESSGNTRLNAAPTSIAAKRPKSSQACSSCRRHKTRCEQIGGGSSGLQRCHRCNVLNMQCSFDDLSIPPGAIPSPKQELSSTPSSRTATGDSDDALRSGSSESHVQPDILVSAPNAPWYFKGKDEPDWTATPMFALQELARCPDPGGNPFVDHLDVPIDNLVTPDQKRFLLETYVKRSLLLLRLYLMTHTGSRQVTPLGLIYSLAEMNIHLCSIWSIVQ
jgi:Fungal Zn(2)-Cys(6) binuclear cluster domain